MVAVSVRDPPNFHHLTTRNLWAPTMIAGVAAVSGTYALVSGMEKFNIGIVLGSLTRETILEGEKKKAASLNHAVEAASGCSRRRKG